MFGRAAGNHLVSQLKAGAEQPEVTPSACDLPRERVERLRSSHSGEYCQDVGSRIRETMQKYAGVYRTQELLNEGGAKVAELREQVLDIHLTDKSVVFNTALVEALEVTNLIEAAQATVVSAAARTECRGAHFVRGYERDVSDPQHPLGRNDQEWLKHTLWFQENNRLDYKPVNLKPLTVDSAPPKVRTF